VWADALGSSLIVCVAFGPAIRRVLGVYGDHVDMLVRVQVLALGRDAGTSKRCLNVAPRVYIKCIS